MQFPSRNIEVVCVVMVRVFRLLKLIEFETGAIGNNVEFCTIFRLLELVEFEITSGRPAPNVSGRNAMVRRPLEIANPPRMNIGTW